MRDVGVDVVEQDVAEAAAEHDADHPVEHQVAEALRIHARQAPGAHASVAEPPGDGETEQVHQAVPMDLERAGGERDRVDLEQVRQVGQGGNPSAGVAQLCNIGR